MIATGRLLLRGWRQEDVATHHALVADPRFMRFLGQPLPLAASQAAMARQAGHLATYGSCFWVVEERGSGAFIGYCGIQPGPAGTPVAGLPEIGWGIAPAHWRRGFAQEAAAACLAWGWAERDWPAIYAITVADNVPSWGLMERLGMAQVEDGAFDHPALDAASPLRRHLLYRIDRPAA